MARQDAQFRPYAAPANIIAVIGRARTRNLPEVINNDLLRIAGVPEGAQYRVMQTLQFLGLIHEDGRPSETFEALSGATQDQYRELLEKVIREAYRSEFNVIDPGQDPQSKIIDAFRPYKPRSQIARMVMLFQGLCREGGIPVLDVPRERRMKETKPKRVKTITETPSTSIESRKVIKQGTETTMRHVAPTLLFGVTDEDISSLDESEFDEVWSALGKVAKARARAKREALEAEITKQKNKEEGKEDK